MLQTSDSENGAPIRRKIHVRGQVQGVGFRPYVYRLATEQGLDGWVSNDGAGVEIEAQGDASQIQRFLTRLERDAPALARVESVHCMSRPCSRSNAGTFLIQPSFRGPVTTGITPDAAVCPECLAELCDSGNRRYRYPFVNCTQCGPRYTITSALPYDRGNTSMARFNLCGECRREYYDLADRRLHAEPNACALCGPKLSYHDSNGICVTVSDIVERPVQQPMTGDILAVKGLGGFHPVCDAHNAEAVARLRERKRREQKPFALMAVNLQSVAPWVKCSSEEPHLLESCERPIVLLPKRDDGAFAGVSPGMSRLDLMLPYTPLHYLLFREAADRPEDTAWLNER